MTNKRDVLNAEGEALLANLEEMTAEELLTWAQERHGNRAGIITSFQDTGCVIVDLMSRVAPGMRVITIDTLRLHPETYEHIRRIEEHYGLCVEQFSPNPERLKRMVEQLGEYLFFDGKEKQEHCCNIRKVEPNQRALATLDVWFTGLRRDQSSSRGGTPKAQYVERGGRPILKIAPLADWTTEQVENHMKDYNIPRNPLYAQGYTSLGCVICSTPTLPHEDARAGRWRWMNQHGTHADKECGLHIKGSGI